FAADVFPLPAQMRESDTFAHAISDITVVWGVYFVARALVRLTALMTLSTNHYGLVIALTHAHFLVAMLAWSVPDPASLFRSRADWAPVSAAEERSVPGAE